MATTIEEELEQLHAQKVERIQRAVGRGGLPTDAEADELFDAMQRVFDLLEDFAIRVGGVSESDVGEELPSAITLEDIGVVAIIVDTATRQADAFRRFSDQITGSVFALDAIRTEQQSRS